VCRRVRGHIIVRHILAQRGPLVLVLATLELAV
jgi:hypothetical protein